MKNKNQQLYLNIYHNPETSLFEYDIDYFTWYDPITFAHKPLFFTNDKYKLKIYIDLNGLKLHERVDNCSEYSLRSYSLIKK